MNAKDVVMMAFEIDEPSLIKIHDKNEKLRVVQMKHQREFTRLSLILNIYVWYCFTCHTNRYGRIENNIPQRRISFPAGSLRVKVYRRFFYDTYKMEEAMMDVAPL